MTSGSGVPIPFTMTRSLVFLSGVDNPIKFKVHLVKHVRSEKANSLHYIPVQIDCKKCDLEINLTYVSVVLIVTTLVVKY